MKVPAELSTAVQQVIYNIVWTLGRFYNSSYNLVRVQKTLYLCQIANTY